MDTVKWYSFEKRIFFHHETTLLKKAQKFSEILWLKELKDRVSVAFNCFWLL